MTWIGKLRLKLESTTISQGLYRDTKGIALEVSMIPREVYALTGRSLLMDMSREEKLQAKNDALKPLIEHMQAQLPKRGEDQPRTSQVQSAEIPLEQNLSHIELSTLPEQE
ncbi:hypothetical protein GOP47_0019359 [Adiantum capillus-veneris]|uniref:Uncharacterized protein n=1 Tax=Adiantum capillus-veneris TaxID=13818 RepID=A0A9D4UCF8_ADICA|nr:hypothetical protein GOP47_0019359 [Adiantum capillus-veneris]